MTTNKTRDTPAYRKWRKQVLSSCEPVCIRCGYPVDMNLPGSHPDGPSADHEPPLAETGDLTPGMDGAGIAHLSCNKSHGGRLGAHRANSKRKQPPGGAKNSRSRGDDRFFKRDEALPPPPRQFPPERPGGAGYAQSSPKMHSDGFVLPRLETARPARVRGSWGEEARAWLADVFGLELRGWQRYALDRALEYDENEELVWSTVIITVGRQSGKSVMSRAVCLWRLHHADHFDEPQTILHVANKRSTAMEVMRPAGLWAAETYGKKATRWGNENAGIELPTGDRWLIHAANDSAGVGYSVSMVFVDEAWKVKRDVVDDALAPTMAERNQPQLWLVSTAGDSTSELMQAYRQRALDRLEDDDPSSVLLLEWSAPAEADPDQVDTWKWASPEWHPKREAFLHQQWNNVEESAWRREYLNQWIIRSDHWLKDSWWNDTLDPTVELPDDALWNIAVESDFDGMGHAVAIAARSDNHFVIRVTTHRTIREVDEKIAAIREQHPQLHIAVTPGYVDRLEQRFDTLVGQREAAAATQTLLDLFDQKAIRHDGSQVLQEHFGCSTISRRQSGWVLTAPMGKSGVYAARASLFALWQAAKTPRPAPMIVTRRRA